MRDSQTETIPVRNEAVMLTGEAKKDYQRKYMRTYMRNKRRLLKLNSRVVKTQTLRPIDADGNVIYED